MNNINLQWKSQEPERPKKQYFFIIKGIIEYKSIPPKHLSQDSMFKLQYILGSTVIKKTKSQFLCCHCTAWFATKWHFSRSKTQRDFTVNNSRHSTQCDEIPTCVAGTCAYVR